ncbi:MAG: hypothetical protein AAGA75_27145 [Cyanobacteria bacterium P01_E01_bin.6]
MLYQDRLKKWAIVRMMADAQPVILERFRSIADAEGYLKVLRKQMPREQLILVFDRPATEEIAVDPVVNVVPETDEASAG